MPRGKRVESKYKARQAWADFIKGMAPWEIWGTFTLKGYSSELRCRNEFNRFIRRLEPSTGEINWFRVSEPGGHGQWHIHGLLRGAERRLEPELLLHRWEAGRARIEVYDPSRGGAWYLAKFWDSRDATVDWDERLLGDTTSRPAIR